MNKQQLAAKIWASANRMRSKIEPNEYKDYILGFIFYKYLSDKEEQYLFSQDYAPNDIKECVNEDDKGTFDMTQKDLGYFIAYKDLFSTWIQLGSDFTVDNVRTALSSFTRLIYPTHKKVFAGIFNTLETGLSKLGENTNSQTKAVRDLVQLIDEIPMQKKQDYDVLGFIYEYLISNFAANAGKKAGEFYTPHEVSLLMSEIVANHLKKRENIKIYDPTSGSGSLLINIGQTTAKYLDSPNSIRYYAQELKSNTYNLTRMNLVMRGILPDNIMTRNGDTLEDDWPYFDESDPQGTYDPLYVDAVVSNPPYSQHWDPAGKENDPRYSRYGLAPKSKADYAFLLHDLYHLRPDGIMTIVLPHGVLFRGGEEYCIRKNLIEQNNIDAIIGLPANIFFGTGIPTIIMVLRQKRDNTDVLIVDASKGFVKEDKSNKLRASDIRRIVDTVRERRTTAKYSSVVSREEIRGNDYNLNIPRYVDSSENLETWDLYSSMFGGIPETELQDLQDYWSVFPSLKKELFTTDGAYAQLNVKDLKAAITENEDVKKFLQSYEQVFTEFIPYLQRTLVDEAEKVSIFKEEEVITANLFARCQMIAPVDAYEVYEVFHAGYEAISGDLEIIQTEGKEAIRQVDPYMVTKKKNNKDVELQEGWQGRILPFDLVQRVLLQDDLQAIAALNQKLSEALAKKEEIIAEMGDDEKQDLLNDDNSDFDAKALKDAVADALSDVQTDTIRLLEQYLTLSKKKEKIQFIQDHSLALWQEMNPNKDGVTYSKTEVNKAIQKLRQSYVFAENTPERRIMDATKAIEDSNALKEEIQKADAALHEKTKITIENLNDDEVKLLLREKWLTPMVAKIMDLAQKQLETLRKKIEELAKKYAYTYENIETEIKKTENELSLMLDELTGSDTDIAAVQELKKFLRGDW